VDSATPEARATRRSALAPTDRRSAPV